MKADITREGSLNLRAENTAENVLMNMWSKGKPLLKVAKGEAA